MKKEILQKLHFLLLCFALLALFLLLDVVNALWQHPVSPPSRLAYVPQFVLISFDGSKSIDIWKDIRTFKDEMKVGGKPLNVTHFINAANFLTDETGNLYKAPQHEPGKSNIGFADSVEDIRARIKEVNMAVADGDEIAPHTVGHFSGLGWSKEDWKDELGSFDRIMFGLNAIYPNANLPAFTFSRNDIAGFRAPYLDRSPGLYDALHELGFRYDTSELGIGNTWPTKDAQGMWHIPLGTLYLGEYKTPVLAMDYNLYTHHTHAENMMKRDTPEWKLAYIETLMAWRDYFDRNYVGIRAPVLVGYHFSTKWNDGLYWEVLKDFSRQVCGMPEVRCGTFKELVKYMEEYGVPKSQ